MIPNNNILLLLFIHNLRVSYDSVNGNNFPYEKPFNTLANDYNYELNQIES